MPATCTVNTRSALRLVTIRKSSEIERTCREGRSITSRLFVMIGRPVLEGPSRLAIKVSRKVGNAVVRNRIRRQVKEIIRHLLPDLVGTADLVVIARYGAPAAAYAKKRDELTGLLVRHGFLGTIRSSTFDPPAGSSGPSSSF